MSQRSSLVYHSFKRSFIRSSLPIVCCLWVFLVLKVVTHVVTTVTLGTSLACTSPMFLVDPWVFVALAAVGRAVSETLVGN